MSIDLSLDERVPRIVEGPEDRPYIDALASNPAWQALCEQITSDAAAMIQALISATPRDGESREAFCARIDALRGEIRGVLRVLEEPVVIRRAIDARRDR